MKVDQMKIQVEWEMGQIEGLAAELQQLLGTMSTAEVNEAIKRKGLMRR
jgi:hypothetical protein